MAAAAILDNNSHTNKDDMHLEAFCLIWLDYGTKTNDAQDTEQKLRSIINYFKKFQNVS